MDTSRLPPTPAEEPTPPRRPRWKVALLWGERLLTLGLLVFVAVRLGPQLGALVGVAPDQGRAPDYELVTLDGDTVRSAELEGKVVVVNFWATWCPPCRLEMPTLQRLHERRAADGVVVLGFSTDVGSDAGVRSFLAERGITYPVGIATADHRRAFGGIPGVPTTFLIDGDGVVRHKVVGYFTGPALNAAVGRLLSGGTSSAP